MRIFVLLFMLATLIGCNLADPEAGAQPEPEPEPEVTCEENSCNGNGTCSVVEGVLTCECDEGFTGAACDGCGPGFQDNDADGSCEASCASAGLTCGDFGTCSDNSGVASCECDEGHEGESCDECAEGFQDDDGDGACFLTCDAAALECGAGECGLEDGEPDCFCPPEYDGESCEICAVGYQDNDGDGVCTMGCDLVDLECPNQQQCDDTGGTPVCACGPGDPCVECPDGENDEDGNGVCTASCLAADANFDWWNPEFRNRVSLNVKPVEDMPVDSVMMVVFDHAAEVAAGRSLESGDDVRVVQVLPDGTFTELARIADTASWNLSPLPVAFQLVQDAPASMPIPGLWLYWNNQNAVDPPTFEPPQRGDTPIDVADPTNSLLCDYRSSTFYSIQLRHLTPGTDDYQIVVRDRTADRSAYGRVILTDAAGNEILRRNYGDIGGSCCDASMIVERTEDVTISATEFNLTLQSGEFSTSHRYFGCKRFGTGHPNFDGSETISYSMGPVPFPSGLMCDRGVPVDPTR